MFSLIKKSVILLTELGEFSVPLILFALNSVACLSLPIIMSSFG